MLGVDPPMSCAVYSIDLVVGTAAELVLGLAAHHELKDPDAQPQAQPRSTQAGPAPGPCCCCCAPPSQGMHQHHPSPVDRAGPGERALERDRRSLPVRARGAAQRLLETLCFERVRRSWHWQPARLRRAWQRSAAATGRQMLAGRPGRVTTLREG